MELGDCHFRRRVRLFVSQPGVLSWQFATALGRQQLGHLLPGWLNRAWWLQAKGWEVSAWASRENAEILSRLVPSLTVRSSKKEKSKRGIKTRGRNQGKGAEARPPRLCGLPACLSHNWKPEVVSGFHRAFETERGKTTGGATVIPPEKENWATSEKIVRGSKCGAADHGSLLNGVMFRSMGCLNAL